MKASEVYRGASLLLLERGWCQGRFGRPDGAACSAGAINAVAGRGRPDRDSGQPYYGAVEDIVDARLATWNDMFCESREDAVAVLDAAYVLALQEEGLEPEDVL
jgi:hypothetical protein